MSDSGNLPSSRIGRLARLASLGARVGVSAVTGNGADVAAKTAADVLGSMRGLAAKVGQMTAYIDGLVPPEHAGAYEKTMKSLLANTPRSSFEAVRGVIEKDLGAPLADVFRDFDQTPLASASIGQVHRAVLLDGTEVAVKVQHPGVAQAVESDLANAGLVEGAISMMGGAKTMQSKAVLEEIRQRFREELDYTLEAERQRAFAVLHDADPHVRVPRVFDAHVRPRVLVTEFVRGRSFDEAREGTDAERRAWAEALWRFVFKGTIVGGMFNADPHPGNYFFHEDGGVSFVDYGCVQPVPDARRDVAARMHAMACVRNEAGFRDAAREMLKLEGGEFEQRSLAYVRHAFEPLFGSPYKITREYTASLVTEFQAMARGALTGKVSGATALPEGMFFMNRLQFGFYSVCARLDAVVDYATVERAFLPPSAFA